MHGWPRALLWAMVVLGLPCAVLLWIDFCTGPLLRWVRARALGSVRDEESGSGAAGGCAPPRSTTPRGGER